MHASAGTHAQWQGLADRVSAQCQVLAPDLHGHGHSPAWPAAAMTTLHVDAHAVAALITAQSSANGSAQSVPHGTAHDEGTAPSPSLPASGVHLVGHSYGAAVALQMALRFARQVRSLTLYEPVLFGMLRELAPRDPSLQEVYEIAHEVRGDMRRGEMEAAAAAFVGFWGGPEAWAALAGPQRAAMARRMPAVPRHFDACFAARWQPEMLARLRMPVLLMNGSRTRAPTRRIVELLAPLLPQASRNEVAGAGHLGPLTHEAQVMQTMADHLMAHALPAPGTGDGAAPQLPSP